ncbi:unnamed protein product [Heligmosomoides polygyrus]|uniref:Uncharacterized protein n=1 Tax=Heligmosomoides polygyrus TaxID=6339 RepID=A0A183GH09_HELPZ|nr:unnamed protein product [Heligmosomoides polygyrus]
MSSREMNPGSSSLTILGRPSGSLKESHNLKADIHLRKDSRGTLYRELPNDGIAVAANTYATQLQKLSEAMQCKRRGRGDVYLLHDNARPPHCKVVSPEVAGA